MGLILVLIVHAASVQDRDGARLVMARLGKRYPRLALMWGDAGYGGTLVKWVAATFTWVLEIVRRSDDVAGFEVLPRRWIVERTFGWIGRYRRTSKDYEYLPESSEAIILIAMINLMAHRLAPEKKK